MLSHISGVPLMSTSTAEFVQFSEALEGSWDYPIRNKDNFREYAKDIWALEGLVLGLLISDEPIGFAAFYWDPLRNIWLTEYMFVAEKRGIGLSKVLLPSLSQSFEDVGLTLGIAIKGGNKRAQHSINKALGTNFPEAENSTLFIVDLVPWTWGTRNHISDGIIVSLITMLNRWKKIV